MAPPKRHWVKVKVPSKFLSTLPSFDTPAPKTKVKKLVQDEKKPADKTASPQPDFNYKINSGLKESSTSGLTMNAIGGIKLDKSGKPVNHWVKRSGKFKTFSGYVVKYGRYRPVQAKAVPTIKEEPTGVQT